MARRDECPIPRIALRRFLNDPSFDPVSELIEPLRKHHCVILSNLAAPDVAVYSDFISEFDTLCRASGQQEKEKCTGPIYTNERGVPCTL
jgi:hypothetical protein